MKRISWIRVLAVLVSPFILLWFAIMHPHKIWQQACKDFHRCRKCDDTGVYFRPDGSGNEPCKCSTFNDGWQNFVCYLIDHAEGETVTEDALQYWAGECQLHNPHCGFPKCNEPPSVTESQMGKGLEDGTFHAQGRTSGVPSTLDERIERAAKEIEGWSPEKRASMQLQGGTND